MSEQLTQWIDAHMDEQLEALKGLLRIPSVSRGTPEPGMPLGRHVYDALDYSLKLARRLGIENTRLLDGYCATAEFGEGEELLMIMAHLDVVPAGSGWDSDPFEPVERNGRLVCRGVLDDKSAAVSALYAMAAVKAAGVPLKRRVRLFLGGDEEVGWSCIERYKKTEELPTMVFTPDGCYPLVNSEMGICQTRFHKARSGSSVRIDCGTAPNVVPGEAAAELSFPAVPCEVPEGFTAEFHGGRIVIHGFGGHAAHNESAKNALQCLLQVLNEQPLPPEDYADVSVLAALLGYDLHGEGFGLDVKDESGRLTLSPDMLKWDDTGITLTIDTRHPFSMTLDTLLKKQNDVFSALGYTQSVIKADASHFIPKESELVSTLLDVYETHIGHHAEPLSIGGGTYARAFENAVAFGLDPEGAESECHMPNESVALKDIRFNTVVFADAIRRLAGK